MSKDTISKRLRNQIEKIEELLCVNRIHFTKKTGYNSFYNYDIAFSANPVKASSRYLYNLGEKGDKIFTMSIGFNFFNTNDFSCKKEPIEKQTVCVSYGVETLKPKEQRISDFTIVNKNDDILNKELLFGKSMDINEAKLAFKGFKNDLKELRDATTKKGKMNPEDVFRLIELHFMEKTFNDEKTNIDAYLAEMQEPLAVIDAFRIDNDKAVKEYETAKVKRKKILAESEEKTLVQSLEEQLKAAKENLKIRENQVTQELNIKKLKNAKVIANKNLDDVIVDASNESEIYLEKNGLPFRYKRHIEDKLKK